MFLQEKRKSNGGPSEVKRPRTALEEIRLAEERRRERANRKDYWLHKGIIVKIVTKKLGSDYYKVKGEVVDVKDKYTAFVEIEKDDGERFFCTQKSPYNDFVQLQAQSRH